MQCAAGTVAADCGTTGNSCVGGACKCTINNVANNACVSPLRCNTLNTANICVECNADGDCAGNANGAYCSLTTGLCGQCKTALVSGRVAMEVQDALTAADRGRGLILACQARAVTADVVVDA